LSALNANGIAARTMPSSVGCRAWRSEHRARYDKERRMNTTTSTPNVGTPIPTDDRVSQHLRTLADEAEALLKATARAGDEKFDATRERLQGELAHLRTRVAEYETVAAARLKDAAHRSDQAVHSHPYAAMGAAAVLGLLLGTLLARR
jgi:ElaB/YqjD/DUF883 family membrane-anchored ribosome-binding protein